MFNFLCRADVLLTLLRRCKNTHNFETDKIFFQPTTLFSLPYKAESGVYAVWILRQRSVSAHGCHGSSTVHVRCMYGWSTVVVGGWGWIIGVYVYVCSLCDRHLVRCMYDWSEDSLRWGGWMDRRECRQLLVRLQCSVFAIGRHNKEGEEALCRCYG